MVEYGGLVRGLCKNGVIEEKGESLVEGKIEGGLYLPSIKGTREQKANGAVQKKGKRGKGRGDRSIRNSKIKSERNQNIWE